MGFLKDMSNWLSGGKKKDTVRSATVKLKVFNKRLMRNTKRMEMTAKQARDKAVRLRKAGDMDGSEFHARNYLQVKKQARAIDHFRTNLEGMVFKLEQANAVKDIADIMKGIAMSLGMLKTQFSVPELTELMTEIGIDMEDFEVTQEITSDGIDTMTLDTAVTDNQVKEILGEIDAEIQVEVGGALPSIDPDGKVKELEDELNKLKSRD
ncbi:MAG: Snf7 family protein [Candidatus Lokiarchaeota archaeon]|nr:Snf7 family protein [Candidatus Lokiarchaeota archaeon]